MSCNVFLLPDDRFPRSLSKPVCVEHGPLLSGFARNDLAEDDAARHIGDVQECRRARRR